MNPTEPENLKQRALALRLYGLIENWGQVTDARMPWVISLLEWEETERKRRGLERRLRQAQLGQFKSLANFDWTWPQKLDRSAVTDLMNLNFIHEAANAVLLGPNGIGKSTVAKNIAHHAVLQGHTVVFTTAADRLNELAAMDSNSALRRRLKRDAQPQLLVIDEVGDLSYGNRHADLLFEIISQRYENKATIVTTNRPFSEWGEVFPNAACVVSLIDRLVHHAEIIVFEGESYRMKEAKARSSQREKKKTLPKPSKKSDNPSNPKPGD